MAGSGWPNPFPLVMGGGATDSERVYRMLRAAVGKGGSAKDDSGIDGLIRKCQARAIACARGQDERAALQALPDRATDALLYYERLLFIALAANASDDARRAAAAARFTSSASIVGDEIQAHLTGIDSRFVVQPVDHDQSTVTEPGRKFEDLAGAEPWGGSRSSSDLPNYATAFVLTALLDLDGEQPDAEDRRVIAEAKAYLAEVLPAHVGAQVVTHVGFRLDIDRLDLTALSP